MRSFLRYCVGLDISKDTLQVCLSIIDATGQVIVRATTKMDNKPAGLTKLLDWVARHGKPDLLLTYPVESTATADRRGLPRSRGLVSPSARPGG